MLLAAEQEGKALILAAVTRDLTDKYSAGEIIKKLAPVIGGKGGGKSDMAQAGGSEPANIGKAIEELYRIIQAM